MAQSPEQGGVGCWSWQGAGAQLTQEVHQWAAVTSAGQRLDPGALGFTSGLLGGWALTAWAGTEGEAAALNNRTRFVLL